MKKLLICSCLNFALISPSYAGIDSPLTAADEIDKTKSSFPLKKLEEGIQEETNVGFPYKPSFSKRSCGFLTREGVVAASIIVGGGIGYAIMCNSYTVEIATDLMKSNAPIFIGSTIGGIAGRVSGNILKWRIEKSQ